MFLVADTQLYTLPCQYVGLSVGPSVGHISELRVVFALQFLPNCPQLDCRVSGRISGLVTYIGTLTIRRETVIMKANNQLI